MSEYEYLKRNSKLVKRFKLKDGLAEIYITPKDADRKLIVPLTTIVIIKNGEKEYYTRKNMWLWEYKQFLEELTKQRKSRKRKRDE